VDADIGQRRISEESPDDLRKLLEAFQRPDGDAEQLRSTLDTGTLDVVVLHILPNPFIGVELGRVPGQEEQLQSAIERCDVLLHGGALCTLRLSRIRNTGPGASCMSFLRNSTNTVASQVPKNTSK